MRISRFMGLGALLLACAMWFGCKSLPKPLPRTTPLAADSTPPAPAPAPETGPAPAPTPAKAMPAPPLAAPAGAWIAADEWSKSNGLGVWQRAERGTNVTFELGGPGGRLAITPGSQRALWNGLLCLLGYAPRLTNGAPHIFSVDADKNMLPLLQMTNGLRHAGGTIVIDPGHGGDNPGAESLIQPHLEKNLTLDWALKLRPKLEALGWKVWLTRTNDTEVGLEDRVRFADQVNADIFISLHFNFVNPGAKVSGVETYCLTPMGLPSHLTRDFPDNPPAPYINNQFDEANLQLAARLQKALVEGAGCTDRGLRRARFMTVLRGQNRPAALIEGGFVSHPVEARLIASEEYRFKLADAVAKALE